MSLINIFDAKSLIVENRLVLDGRNSWRVRNASREAALGRERLKSWGEFGPINLVGEIDLPPAYTRDFNPPAKGGPGARLLLHVERVPPPLASEDRPPREWGQEECGHRKGCARVTRDRGKVAWQLARGKGTPPRCRTGRKFE